MSKKIIVCAVFAVMSSLMVAGPASAAHCFEDGSPGFSYFGQEGRESTDNVESKNPGATECVANTGSPSDRAPGQTNK
jgi:hypothetical protein